jgi:hypothetical protein
MAAIACGLALCLPSTVMAQSRWDKLQQKLEEMRPQGKFLQKIKEGIEGAASDPTHSATRSNQTPARSAVWSKPGDSRTTPKPTPRQSILDRSRVLASGGVVLGVQIDPKFLPAGRLLVSEVDRGSPADRAGIRTGDQIVAIGGNPTDSLKAFDGVLSSLHPGDQVIVELVRNRKSQSVSIAFPGSAAQESEPPGDTASAAEPSAGDSASPPSFEGVDMVAPQSRPDGSGLRSVLLGPPTAARNNASAHSPPSYFSAASESQEPAPLDPGSITFAPTGTESLGELRATILRQQQIIEQLQTEIQQLQSVVPMGSLILEGETLILDADGN